jgi:hypothetical protein
LSAHARRNLSVNEYEAEPMELSEYLLEMLRQDGEFILYRGRRRRPGEVNPPTTLLVTPLAEHPALASLRRMEQESSLRPELDPGWAAQPLALVSHQGRTMLVLADPGGEPLDRLLGSPLELSSVFAPGRPSVGRARPAARPGPDPQEHQTCAGR